MSSHTTARRVARQLVLGIGLFSVGLAQTPSQIQRIVSAGSPPSMRWQTFRSSRPALQHFYEPVNYAPAWVQGNTPSPQALAMISLFQNAWKKGLEPEDYDASRWGGRLQALESSSADPSDFDVSVTVSTMRYVSDLRIGRI